MSAVLDEKGLRLAREIRKAIEERDGDEDLQNALEVYDRAVTPAERQAAGAYLLLHSTVADNRYTERVTVAVARLYASDLLPEDER
jgi:hypothetical protein